MLRHPGRTVKLLSGSPPSLYVAAPAGRHDSVEVLAALLDARLAALTRSIATALEIAVVSPELVRLEIDLPSIDEIPETLANVNVMKQPIYRRVTKRHCQCLHIYACAGALVKLVHEVFMSLPTVHEVEAIGTRPHGEGFTPILNRRDWDAFIRERRSGRIRPANVEQPRAVGNRIIEQDLRCLLAVLNWATRAGDRRGGLLLERNPLAGLPVPKEESPRRPMLSEDEYRARLKVAAGVHPTFEVALVVAHETGHRGKAIRLLRWGDIDFQHERIRWRAESDKIGYEHTPPASKEALAVLERWRRQRGDVIGDGWGVPRPERSITARLAAPAQAVVGSAGSACRDEITHVQRRGWHSFRRNLATELEVPLKDLCYLGGWKDHNTVLKCYQQPREQVMRTGLKRRAAARAAGE